MRPPPRTHRSPVSPPELGLMVINGFKALSSGVAIQLYLQRQNPDTVHSEEQTQTDGTSPQHSHPPGLLAEEGNPRRAEVTGLQGARGPGTAHQGPGQHQPGGRQTTGSVARLTSLSAWLGGGLASAGTRPNKSGANPHGYAHGRYAEETRCVLLPGLGSAHRKQV